MKASNKKLKPRNIRNKHAKAYREMLKNKKQKVSAKIIYYT
jgi:hypothetical protein